MGLVTLFFNIYWNTPNTDMVIKTAGAPLDSPYIAEARKNNIPIEMDASLFAKLTALSTSNVDIIGITGTRGKSTVTHLIYSIIKNYGRRVYLGGNVKGLATLPLLKKVKSEDIVVMELDSWQLQGFADAKISPNIAVFTTFLPDHQNYYKNDMDRYFSDKANIYRWQKDEDCLIAGVKTAKLIKEKVTNSVLLCCTETEEFFATDDFENEFMGLLSIHPIGVDAVKHFIKGNGELKKLKLPVDEFAISFAMSETCKNAA